MIELDGTENKRVTLIGANAIVAQKRDRGPKEEDYLSVKLSLLVTICKN